MKVSELRKAGEKMGRSGLSQAAIDLINNFDGSYNGVIQLCGQLSVIAKACGFDEYWQEQVNRGVQKVENSLQDVIDAN
jgi:hypothetical protein